MAVLDRSELEASPLADLHAIADQLGLEGFRRLRKADLIDAILGESGDERTTASAPPGNDAEESRRGRRRRAPRLRRGRSAEADQDTDDPKPPAAEAETAEVEAEAEEDNDGAGGVRASSRSAGRRGRSRGGRETRRGEGGDAEAPVVEGVVEVLGNGSAFLRVEPPEPSDDDVYISAAQVRRCELVSGDRVAGPVRTPRRSERYPSLVRIDTINGDSAETVSDGARYEDLPVSWPSERIELRSDDKTLEAIDVLVPLGKGSRATIAGARGAGKSATLRRIFDVLGERGEYELSVVLLGARPEEISDWQTASPPPVAALSFAASADAQAQALERALDAARRVAARGGDAIVLIDSLDGVQPQAARRALAAARNLRDAGSLTLVATAGAPLGGETTVVALDAALALEGGAGPILDLAASGTLRVELLVGEKDAAAIAKARAKALKDR
jgi:transcription termination factor Rho